MLSMRRPNEGCRREDACGSTPGKTMRGLCSRRGGPRKSGAGLCCAAPSVISPFLPPTPRWLRHSGVAFALALVVFSLAGCLSTSALRAEIREVGADVQAARKQGALRCAPRELALAEANHRFASLELDQGSPGRARTHLRVASLHAQAALERVSGRSCGGALVAPSASSAAAPTVPTALTVPEAVLAPAAPSTPGTPTMPTAPAGSTMMP